MWLLLLALTLARFDQAKIDKLNEFMRVRYKEPAALFDGQRHSQFIPHPQFFNPGKLKIEPGRADIVVGDVPGETLNVTGYFFNEGNIFVFNDGVLKIRNANFNLNGDIYIYGGGKATADSSTLNIIQYYIYHHSIVLADSGKFFITDCNTAFNGYQISLAVAGQGELRMDNVTNRDWITAGLYQNGRALLNRVGITGEWLFSNGCYARFNRVDYLLTWYFFENGSDVILNFPETDTVQGFYIDSTLPNVHGINYHVAIDSSTNCMWATIPLRGSTVIVDSSVLRTTGLMFNGADTFGITGLVNNQNYADWTLPVSDRLFRLRNTTIQTWNLYPADSTRVDVTSSIFGELCAYDHSFATIMNAFCDGSGGHIEASGNALNFCFMSSLSCDVIAKNRGLLVMGYTSMTMGNIWATGAAIMVVVNSQFPEDPIPSDTAIVFVAAVTGPSSGRVNDTIPISGSAWVDKGPYNPQDFAFYRLFYRPAGDSVWRLMSDSQFTEVRHSTLGFWNTVGFSEGAYEVRLLLKDLTGDSVEALKQVTLRILGQNETASKNYPDLMIVKLVRPRRLYIEDPFPRSGYKIIDILGRELASFKSARIYWTAPAAGIYYIKKSDWKTGRKAIVY
jgi:hypothetical protein